MANTYLCPACGTTNPAQATHCKGCGQAVPPGGGVRETLFELDQPATSKWDWKWVFVGTAIILGLQAVIGLLLVPALLINALALGTGGLLILLVLLSAASYFFGGLLVGRLSSGFTVKEPAVAGALAAAANWLLEAYVFRNADAGLGVLALAALGCMILAALGGSAGETLQQRSEQRKRDKLRARQAKA